MLRAEKYSGMEREREVEGEGGREREREVLEAESDSAETDRMEGWEVRSAESQTEARLKLQAEQHEVIWTESDW